MSKSRKAGEAVAVGADLFPVLLIIAAVVLVAWYGKKWFQGVYDFFTYWFGANGALAQVAHWFNEGQIDLGFSVLTGYIRSQLDAWTGNTLSGDVAVKGGTQ